MHHPLRSTACIALALACFYDPSPAAAAEVPPPEYVERVTIQRDSYGIPHIHGKSDADVAFGLAYAHAEDDFPTIQLSLASARGRLAELTGAEGLPLDYVTHLFKVQEIVAEKFESDLSGEFRAVCEGYAAGLTYYATLHPDEADSRLLPYTGHDIVAGFVQKAPLFFGLEGQIRRLQRMKKAVDSQSSSTPPNPPLPRGGKGGELVWTADHGFPQIGSNAFAVGPSRSADGRARLAVNSHQPWEGPVTWYEAHLVSDEGWNAIGGLFPGTPIVLHGHNQALGWAMTVNSPDLVDVYRLTVNSDNKNQYRLDDQWVDFETRQVQLRIGLGGTLSVPVPRKLLYSAHGPVMQFDHGSYAIRYAGWGDIRMGQQWYQMNRAQNLTEWLAAMKMRAIGSLNVCYADRDGNIYYLYNAHLPKRTAGFDWAGIVPGDQSRLIWTEYHPFESLPQVLNPASGFLQNCNSAPYQTTIGEDNPQPDRLPEACGIESHMTDRADRILKLYDADPSINHDEFLRYKFDQTIVLGGKMWSRIEPLLAEKSDDADEASAEDSLSQAVALLQGWDRRAVPDSHGAAIAVLVNYQFEKAAFLGQPQPEPEQALRLAVEHLEKHFGRVDVALGDLQRLRRGNVDLPLGGAPHVLGCVHAREDEKDGRLVGLVGDSYVLIVAFDKQGVASSQAIHQYGNVNRPDSRHYADQAPLFVKQTLRDSNFHPSDVAADVQRSYHPGEEAGRAAGR